MGTIILEKLQFKAYHGYYDEEREMGNHFEVTVTIQTDFEQAAVNDELEGTVDYSRVYEIVREQMQNPAHLLEHVAHRIVNALMDDIQRISSVKVELSKMNAPIGGPCHAATIILERSRS